MSADPAFWGEQALYNPEECLLAVLANCHMVSYLAFAALAKIKIFKYEDHATGIMRQKGAGGYFCEAVLRP